MRHSPTLQLGTPSQCSIVTRARRSLEPLSGCKRRRRQRTETSKPSRRGRKEPRGFSRGRPLKFTRCRLACTTCELERRRAPVVASVSCPLLPCTCCDSTIQLRSSGGESARRLLGSAAIEVRRARGPVVQAPSSDSKTSSEKRRRLCAFAYARFLFLGFAWAKAAHRHRQGFCTGLRTSRMKA